MGGDIEMTAEWGEGTLTPVSRVCPDCAEEQIVLDTGTQPPGKPAEAWALMRCCGTADMRKWRWCSRLGEMAMPHQGLRVRFDRRLKNQGAKP